MLPWLSLKCYDPQRKIGDGMHVLFYLGSLTAFIFLGYTLANLKRLGITWHHPRVMVEATLGIGFLVIALIWRL